jgi:type II secretory pathway pseudopilin PulG
MSRRRTARRKQAGISLPEVLAAIIIIAVTAVPVADTIRGSMAVAESDAAAVSRHYHLVSKMEEVLAEPFASLNAAALGPATVSPYSDDAGSDERRMVYIAAYDGDNADGDKDPSTGTDEGLLWIRVEIEGRPESLQALRSDL